MDANNMILNRFFSKNTFSDLINYNRNTVYFTTIKRYLNAVESEYNKNLISEIYGIMTKKYRNEYFYKNTLFNKLLIGRHSLKTTTALSEVLINKSKADLVLINGKAVVYEIKTELDNLDRLDNQLNNYYKAFNNVCVVTCESNYDRIQSLLSGTTVGICILTNNNAISTRQAPVTNNSKLEYSTMFKILRKSEFENIILNFYHELPITNQVNYYSECFKMFQSIQMDKVYQCMLKELKKRNVIEIDEYKSRVPYELRFLIYFSKYKRDDYLKLSKFLDNEIGGEANVFSIFEGKTI